MSDLPSLADAPWLAMPATQRVLALLAESGEEGRVVGGAVRNTLMGLPAADIDIATTALPEKTVALAVAAGIRHVPTGIDHGTVTLIVDGHAFEVTTLREDIETDGRHAVVRYGRDWEKDAGRRDFTMNALFVGADGRLADFVGGVADIAARRVRFIGEAERRIAEDRLRILRLFRFHAEYGDGVPDTEALSASIRARRGLAELSGERLGQEMRKLVLARGSAATLTLMQDSGILPVIIGGAGYVRVFARAVQYEAEAGLAPAVAPRLAAVGCRVSEDALRLTERLRLSNAERERMLAAVNAAQAMRVPPDERAARRLLHASGEEAFRDGLMLAAAWSGSDMAPWLALNELASRRPVPPFPLGGRDVIGAGIQGRAVGELLRAVENWWIAQDFQPDEAALRARLQQMIAAQQ